MKEQHFCVTNLMSGRNSYGNSIRYFKSIAALKLSKAGFLLCVNVLEAELHHKMKNLCRNRRELLRAEARKKRHDMPLSYNIPLRDCFQEMARLSKVAVAVFKSFFVFLHVLKFARKSARRSAFDLKGS